MSAALTRPYSAARDAHSEITYPVWKTCSKERTAFNVMRWSSVNDDQWKKQVWISHDLDLQPYNCFRKSFANPSNQLHSECKFHYILWANNLHTVSSTGTKQQIGGRWSHRIQPHSPILPTCSLFRDLQPVTDTNHHQALPQTTIISHRNEVMKKMTAHVHLLLDICPNFVGKRTSGIHSLLPWLSPQNSRKQYNVWESCFTRISFRSKSEATYQSVLMSKSVRISDENASW